MHARADGHETPKSVSLVPLGAGAGWIRQLLPSHRSASGSVKLESEAADEPTAVHARPEEHATDDSTLILSADRVRRWLDRPCATANSGFGAAGERRTGRDNRRQPKQQDDCPKQSHRSAASSHRLSLP